MSIFCIEQVQEAFSLFDKNGDGTISVNELREAMNMAGHNATEEFVKNLLDVHDKDGTLRILGMLFCKMQKLWERLGLPVQCLCEVCLSANRLDLVAQLVEHTYLQLST